MLAIATESVVKLLAFMLVGSYITFGMFGGLGPLIERAAETPQISELFTRGFDGGAWITVTFLSLVCIILLPRQFHVTVVENNSENEVRRAAWLFPLYLIGINLFVVAHCYRRFLSHSRTARFQLTCSCWRYALSDGAQFVTLAAFHRWAFSSDRHGDRSNRGTLDHGLQRSGCTSVVAATVPRRKPRERT